MQGLKALVIGMGVLIVLLATAIGWGLWKKSQDPDFSMFGGSKPAAEAPAALPAPADAGAAWGEVALPVAGCPIDEVVPHGRLAHLRVRADFQGRCPALFVFDPVAGRMLGSVVFPSGK